ncbi:MAG: hypothetical protein KJ051_01075 [Thermoleophilia bacterium]|nr:hypothetical protein [Thermoleophilia bacterium]
MDVEGAAHGERFVPERTYPGFGGLEEPHYIGLHQRRFRPEKNLQTSIF